MMADARRAPLKDQTDISGARALIVEARFYDDIQDALLVGAVTELKAAGLSHDVLTVPGALEIPAAIAIALDAAAQAGKPAGGQPRQESQPPRCGAAGRGAGALPDGHWRRGDQRHLCRV
jgi:hypothetical protein